MTDVVLLIADWLLVGCGIAWAMGRVSDCGSCSMRDIADLAGQTDGVVSSRCNACLGRRPRTNAIVH